MPILGKRKNPKSDVWLTPEWVLDRLGKFDLDPCAAPVPRPWKTARKMITLPDDGLGMKWRGRVWMNPPFSNIHPWIRRISEYGNGIALVPARVETGWFHDFVWKKADALFFFRHRVNFCEQSGEVRTGVDFPTVIAAYGLENADSLFKINLPGKLILP